MRVLISFIAIQLATSCSLADETEIKTSEKSTESRNNSKKFDLPIGTTQELAVVDAILPRSIERKMLKGSDLYSKVDIKLLRKKDFMQKADSKKIIVNKKNFESIKNDYSIFIKEILPYFFDQASKKRLSVLNIFHGYYTAEASTDGCYRVCHMFGTKREGEFGETYPDEIRLRCFLLPSKSVGSSLGDEVADLLKEAAALERTGRQEESSLRQHAKETINRYRLSPDGRLKSFEFALDSGLMQLDVVVDNTCKSAYYLVHKLTMLVCTEGLVIEIDARLNRKQEIINKLHVKGGQYGQLVIRKELNISK